MSISTIVSLVVNVLFALVIVLGFFIGVRRGWKKATLRLGVILVCVVVLSFVSPIITKSILNINIGGHSVFDSISEGITSGESADFFASNPSMLEFVESTIVTVANLVVFVIANIVVAMLSYFIYLIVAAICFRSEKKEKKRLKKEKKALIKAGKLEEGAAIVVNKKPANRWYGGISGVAHAFIILFVIFLPFNGIMSAYNEIMKPVPGEEVSSTTSGSKSSGTDSLSVQSLALGDDLFEDSESSSQEALPTSVRAFVNQFLDEMPMVKDVIGAYNSSALKATSGIFGFDGACFDSLTKFKINGETVVLRADFINACKFYNDFAPFYNEYILTKKDISEYDFDTISKLLDKAFGLTTVKALSQELVPYVVDELIVNNEEVEFGEYTPQIKALLKDMIDDYKNEGNIATGIKSDILVFVDSVKLLQKDNYLELISDGDFDKIVEKLIDAAENGEDGAVEAILDIVFRSSRIKTLFYNGYNLAIDVINDKILEDEPEDGKIAHFTKDNFDISKDVETLKSVYKNGIIFYASARGEKFQEFKLTELKTAVTKMFDLQFVNQVISKVVPVLVDKYTDDIQKELGEDSPDIQAFLEEFTKAYGSDNAVATIKGDLSVVVDIAIEIQNSKISDFKIDSIKKLLTKESGKTSTFENIIARISTKRYNDLVINIYNNVLIPEINKKLELTEGNGVDKLETFNLAGDKTHLNTIALNALLCFEKLDETEKFDDEIIGYAETAVDSFMETSIFTQIAPSLAKSLINKYAKVTAFDSDLNDRLTEKLSSIADSYTSLAETVKGETLKKDIKAIINIAKVLQKEELINNLDADIIKNLTGNSVNYENNGNKTKADVIVDAFLGEKATSNTKILAVEAFNIVVGVANENLGLSIDYYDGEAPTSEKLSEFLSLVADAYDGIKNGVNLDNSNLTPLAKLLQFLQEESYNVITDSTTNENTLGEPRDSIFTNLYNGLIDYLCDIDKYGEKIEKIVKDESDKVVYVNWESLFKLVTTAQSIAKNGVTGDNVVEIITSISENKEIADEITNIVKEQFGESASDDINTIIETIKDASQDDIKGITDAIGSINDVVSSETEISSEDSATIAAEIEESLNTDKAQEIINKASEMMTGGSGMDLNEDQKENVTSIIDNISDSELQKTLANLFGITLEP